MTSLVLPCPNVVPMLPPEGEYWIAPSAVLIGDVRLKREASIWFGTVLRADDDIIEIGERSNVQDGCVLHVDPGYPLTIGEDCTIGHKVMLHGCTIGSNTLIGHVLDHSERGADRPELPDRREYADHREQGHSRQFPRHGCPGPGRPGDRRGRRARA